MGADAGGAVRIEPTVGRVVWYWHGDDDVAAGMVCLADNQPMRADIAFVHADGTVNLVVNDHQGCQQLRERVRLVQGDDAFIKSERHCVWMPYQRGQAAKTAAAEAEVGELRNAVAGVAASERGVFGA